MLLRRLPPAALLMLAGCAAIQTPGAAPTDRPKAEARQAVRELATNFEGARAETLFESFDDQDFPNWENFRYAVRQFLLANRDITLDIIVDDVVSDESETSVQAHWNRSYVTPSGTSKTDEGSCEFIFDRKGPGLHLVNIRGGSPFS